MCDGSLCVPPPAASPIPRAGVAISVTVPFSTDTVSVAPELLHSEVEGVRVEVNGQVLSRGGDLSADRRADTSPLEGGGAR